MAAATEPRATPALIDITSPISPSAIVWPGDTQFRLETQWSATEAGGVTVASIHSTGHVGTHADAPLHVYAHGATVGDTGAPAGDAAALPLEPFLGPCTVVHCLDAPSPLPLAAVLSALDRHRAAGRELHPRLLIRSYTTQPRRWADARCGVAAELIDALHQLGVRLVGLELSSFDPEDCSTMDAHKALFERGMFGIEQLDLTLAPEGNYELIALPISLAGADAAPIRAVLRPLSD